jgi:hypothetical protein
VRPSSNGPALDGGISPLELGAVFSNDDQRDIPDDLYGNALRGHRIESKRDTDDTVAIDVVAGFFPCAGGVRAASHSARLRRRA